MLKIILNNYKHEKSNRGIGQNQRCDGHVNDMFNLMDELDDLKYGKKIKELISKDDKDNITSDIEYKSSGLSKNVLGLDVVKLC